ncbi:MAG: hypothetical protein R3B48_26920 [Kofleriaceae bacterium]
MTISRRGASAPLSAACVNGSWTMDLDAGDYLMELQTESWQGGGLTIVAELGPNQSAPAFVVYSPPAAGGSQGSLSAWQAKELSYISDPKDPWPPPPPPTFAVVLTPESAAWFDAQMSAARVRIALVKECPADLLESLVNGPESLAR